MSSLNFRTSVEDGGGEYRTNSLLIRIQIINDDISRFSSYSSTSFVVKKITSYLSYFSNNRSNSLQFMSFSSVS